MSDIKNGSENDVIAVDVVCPLYKVNVYIERFIEKLKRKKGIEVHNCVFAILFFDV